MWLKLTCLKIGQTNVTYFLLWYTEEGYIISVVFLAKMHHLNIIMRKHQTNSNWGTVYTMTGPYIKNKNKKTVSWKTKKGWGAVPDHRKLNRHDDWVQHVILGWTLDQKKTIALRRKRSGRMRRGGEEEEEGRRSGRRRRGSCSSGGGEETLLGQPAKTEEGMQIR